MCKIPENPNINDGNQLSSVLKTLFPLTLLLISRLKAPYQHHGSPLGTHGIYQRQDILALSLFLKFDSSLLHPKFLSLNFQGSQ